MTTPKPALPEPDGYFYEVDGFGRPHDIYLRALKPEGAALQGEQP